MLYEVITGDVLPRRSLLDRLADVRVDEGRAVLSELEGRVRGQRYRCDVLGAVYGKVAGRRLLEEAAGARGAGLVHRVVDRNAVLEQHVLGVLAADLEDGLDALVEVGGADGVGDDLVVHAGRLEEHAEYLSGASRRGGQLDVDLGVAGVGDDLVADDGEAFLERLDRVSVGAAVVARDYLVGLGVDEAGRITSYNVCYTKLLR